MALSGSVGFVYLLFSFPPQHYFVQNECYEFDNYAENSQILNTEMSKSCDVTIQTGNFVPVSTLISTRSSNFDLNLPLVFILASILIIVIIVLIVTKQKNKNYLNNQKMHNIPFTEQSGQRQLICNNCHQKINIKDNYCENCGSRIE